MTRASLYSSLASSSISSRCCVSSNDEYATKQSPSRNRRQGLSGHFTKRCKPCAIEPNEVREIEALGQCREEEVEKFGKEFLKQQLEALIVIEHEPVLTRMGHPRITH